MLYRVLKLTAARRCVYCSGVGVNEGGRPTGKPCMYSCIVRQNSFAVLGAGTAGTMMNVSVSTLPPPSLSPPIGALPALHLFGGQHSSSRLGLATSASPKLCLTPTPPSHLSMQTSSSCFPSAKTLRRISDHLVMQLLRFQDASPLFTLESGS